MDMKNTRRYSAFVFLPAALILAGALGNSCSQQDDGAAAQYQAAYLAALASATMNNMSTATVYSTMVSLSTVTAVATVTSSSGSVSTSSSGSTAITTIFN